MKVTNRLWEKLRNNIFTKNPDSQREKTGKGLLETGTLEPAVGVWYNTTY